MTPAELEAAPSFALLGPGFGGDPFLLLRDLRRSAMGTLKGFPCPPAMVRRRRGRARSARGGQGGGWSRSPRRGQSRQAPHADGADPLLVFARFEQPGNHALRLAAGTVSPCAIEFDHEPRDLGVALAASDYVNKVGQIREAIACGDVYQVCLTVRALVSPASGAEILSLMCRRGVPRFAAWVRLPDGGEFVSASPELFFETRGRQVHAEPMKGTARSGAVLEASDKDRAELAMITDLVRNDLAQVCRQKTVRVENERRVLELPYALQTVSDIFGVLDDGKAAMDVLAALHPGGSVTGAPKPAALAMIRRLEPAERGAYCGALGLLTGEGSVFSLLIRTAVRTPGGWVYGVGSGIVFDSDAQAEWEEIRVKLGALRSS